MEHRILPFAILLLSLPLAMGDCGWWWGAVSPTHCRWGGWSYWSSCTHKCGNAGTQSRSRSIAVHAACGGSGCYGSSSETRSCNRFCYNGGYPRYASCSCTESYWNTCCDRTCTSISNCKRISCTSGTNQICLECNYDRGENISAYQLISLGSYKNRICQQLCSWRPDSQFCYPGTCEDVPDSCKCASGYTSNSSNCMTINKAPDITHCLVKMERVAEAEVQDSVDVPCNSTTPNNPVYTNIRDRLTIDWYSQFLQPSATDYPLSYYVHSFKNGIIKGDLKWEIIRGSSVVYNSAEECANGFSKNNPNQGTHMCSHSLDIGLRVAHNDKLIVTTTAYSGGYVKLNNYDSSSTPVVTPPKYYTGSSLSYQAEHVHFDFVPPVHCSLSQSCEDEKYMYLDVRPTYTKKARKTAKWSGWSDFLSGLEGYELDVYKMHAPGDELDIQLTSPLNRHIDIASLDVKEKVELSEPGLYCFLLTVKDVAGNSEMARKFVLYDDTSSVEAVADSDKAMVVDSADANTSYTWITELTGKVQLSWRNHFTNKFHHEHKLLSAIRPHSPPLSADYEDRAGQSSKVRSMEAIPNINGVTSYQVLARVDHEGGKNKTAPDPDQGWIKVKDFQTEQISLKVDRRDGDSIRLFVRGEDVMDNYAMDSIVVHVDSSAPDLTVLGMANNDQKGQNRKDCLNIELDFEASDPHSGLYSISYEMYLTSDYENSFDQGVIPVKQMDTCDPSVCTCVPATQTCFYNRYQMSLQSSDQMSTQASKGKSPKSSSMTDGKGQREMNYYFKLSVTNNAQFVTTKKYKVQCDVDPPGINTVVLEMCK